MMPRVHRLGCRPLLFISEQLEDATGFAPGHFILDGVVGLVVVAESKMRNLKVEPEGVVVRDQGKRKRFESRRAVRVYGKEAGSRNGHRVAHLQTAGACVEGL